MSLSHTGLVKRSTSNRSFSYSKFLLRPRRSSDYACVMSGFSTVVPARRWPSTWFQHYFMIFSGSFFRWL